MMDEDCNGQRLLYSRSPDGKNWTVPKVLLPNLTTPGHALTLELGPCVHINGRRYCGGSPGFWQPGNPHDQSAQGSQWCLWPDPLNPRNCGPPTKVAIHYSDSLLVREVRAGGTLGPMFWASDRTPKQFESITKAMNIPALPKMDAQTQADFQAINKDFTDGRT